MYRHCIYCSAELGANEALEGFPVGRSIAFDAARGRLWAVCPRCARWNLAPLEERWEVVEAAERRFRDTRLRAQSENVGVAKLPDGTRLVRIGAALPGEVAAWRYGTALVRRGRGARLRAGRETVAEWGRAARHFMAALLATESSRPLAAVRRMRREDPRQVIHRLPPNEHGYGYPLHARDFAGAFLSPGEGGELRLRGASTSLLGPGFFELRGEAVRNALARLMVSLNRRGASAPLVDLAIEAVAAHPSADAYLAHLAACGTTLGSVPARAMDYYGWRAEAEGIPDERRLRWQVLIPFAGDRTALAMEMALHEEQERRAMQGELALLEAAWREAEEIAAIADRLAVGALSAATES